jgi:hypothetical protein
MMKKIFGVLKAIILSPIFLYGWLKEKVSSLIFKIFPGKKTLKLGSVLALGVSLFLALVILISLLFSPEDTGSHYTQVYSSQGDGDTEGEFEEYGDEIKADIKGITKGRAHRLSGDDPSPVGKKGKPIKYRGKQVLVRASSQGDRALPTGTNLIGKLLSSIDTRHTDKFVRVMLPFGGKFRDRVGIPKGTVLLGTINYSGRGDRVFLSFHAGVLPDGQEIDIEATAMDSKDFSPGLIGSYHSAFGSRAGATLGFSFAAGASDVLQEREALGHWQATTPKPTMKNAVLNGISEFSRTEGSFQLEEARQDGAYVTLNQGKELIITLTKTFKNGESKE